MILDYCNPAFPEPPLEPRYPHTWLSCQDTNGCNEPIYEGDEYYEIDGYVLCADCGKKYIDELYKHIAGGD